MDDDKPKSLKDWLKSLSSWLSFSAIIISLYTFIVVDLNPGRLIVVLPQEIGVMLNYDGGIDLLVPTVIYNTGAQRKQRVVLDITADLTDETNQVFKYRWRDSWDFIGKIEFEKEYPQNRARLPADEYIIYDSRRVPFIILGGEFNTQNIRLKPEDPIGAGEELGNFKLNYAVITEGKIFKDKIFKITESYAYKGELIPGQYVWFQKSD